MPFFYHFAAWLQAALLILCFYVHGYWLTALTFPERRQQHWAVMPLLGALAQAIALAHLSYAGLAISASVWPLLAASLGLGIGAWRKTRMPFWHAEWAALAVCGGAAALFLLPYVLYNSYPFIGDSFMYDAISDFLLDRGYFANPEPAEAYPWLTMMRYAQQVHLALGASVTQAAAVALLQKPSSVVFMPLTAAFLFLSLCGLRLLLASRGAIAGLLIYGTNVPLVLLPPSINLLRQVAGTGYFFALAAIALDQPTRWQLGLLLAGLVTFYPEYLPFALAPLAVYVLWRREWLQAVRIWAAAFGISVLLNIYGWYSAIQNVLFHWQAKPGFEVSATGAEYLRHYAGMGDHAWAGWLVGVVAAYGFWRLGRPRQVYVGAALVIFGLLGLYLYFGQHYTYGVYKNVLFSYFLVVVCLAAALQGRWAWVAVAAWMVMVFVPVRQFVRSDYGIQHDGAYQELRGPGRMLELFAPLQTVNAKGRTLIAIADEQIAKWVVYYFRQPSGLLFSGGYLPIAKERPLKTTDTNFDGVLIRTADTSLKDDQLITWRNPMLALSAAQTFVTFGQSGWLSRSVGVESASRVMGAKADLIAYVPHTDRVQLIGSSTSSCHIGVNGESSGESADGFWRSGEIALSPGFTTIWITTDCAPMRWDSLSLVKPLHGQVNLMDAGSRQMLSGLTEDGWMLKQGIRVVAGGVHKVQLAGETFLAPQALLVTAKDRTERVEIPKAGHFDVTVELPGEDVTIKPERVQEAGHGDLRQLGVRLTQVLAW